MKAYIISQTKDGGDYKYDEVVAVALSPEAAEQARQEKYELFVKEERKGYTAAWRTEQIFKKFHPIDDFFEVQVMDVYVEETKEIEQL